MLAELFLTKIKDMAFIDGPIYDRERLREYCDEIKKTPPQKGDVIFCNRALHTYRHFGIYIGNNQVIHFAKVGENFNIIKSSLDEFCKGDNVYVMTFPEKYNPGDKSVIMHFLRGMLMEEDYRVRTPEETVARAESCLNKEGIHDDGYNVVFNNCEDFAIWCKTGVYESKQVNNFIDNFIP